MPAEMKYFCISEQTAYYLQKYIVLRKRKLFTGEKTAADLFDIIKKHKTEKFLFPCSNIRKNDIPDFMRSNNLHFTEAVIYKTVPADLSDLAEVKYDCLAFFSPSGIHSLFMNFPTLYREIPAWQLSDLPPRRPLSTPAWNWILRPPCPMPPL